MRIKHTTHTHTFMSLHAHTQTQTHTRTNRETDFNYPALIQIDDCGSRFLACDVYDTYMITLDTDNYNCVRNEFSLSMQSWCECDGCVEYSNSQLEHAELTDFCHQLHTLLYAHAKLLQSTLRPNGGNIRQLNAPQECIEIVYTITHSNWYKHYVLAHIHESYWSMLDHFYNHMCVCAQSIHICVHVY